MNDTLLCGITIIILLTIMSIPLVRWYRSTDKTRTRYNRFKYDNQRRDADIALFERFLKTIPYEKGTAYFSDDFAGGIIKNEEIDSLAPFREMFTDPEFFFFDREIQKSLDKLIESVGDYDSVQIGYFMRPENRETSSDTENMSRNAMIGVFLGFAIGKRSNTAYTKERLKAAADNVEEKYRDFVAVAETRLAFRR